MTDTFPHLTLVLGGARSGKSARALALAETAGDKRCYLATAQALDQEMRARIEKHKRDRGPGWAAVEAPLDLAGALADIGPDFCDVLLIDCLTLWLSNLMHHEIEPAPATDALIGALRKCPVPAILVSNEVGLSIVPENRLARAFRDEQGLLNQRIAAVADRVELVTAGLPLVLKGGQGVSS
jgi:adenosylcobinamide kinase/adenosylcobinamide-phosphate guanylyltransferase